MDNSSMNLEEVEEIVTQTIGELPAEFKDKLENVAFSVEPWPSDQDLQSIFAHPGTILFGLYRGIPKTKRGDNYNAVLPDKIIIFAGPLLQFSKDLEDAKTQIKKTVLHEIGHYFGMSEAAIRKAQRDFE